MCVRCIAGFTVDDRCFLRRQELIIKSNPIPLDLRSFLTGLQIGKVLMSLAFSKMQILLKV